MEHVVFFPASDGSPAFRRLPSVEEAVRLVEHLRNVEGVDRVSVHALTEIPLAFRAYYRVELPAPPAQVRLAAALAAQPVDEVMPPFGIEAADAAPVDAAHQPEPEPQPLPVEVEVESVQPAAGDHEPEPIAASAFVDLPVQGGEQDPLRMPNPSLGFFA